VLERDRPALERLRGVADQVFVGDANDRHALRRAGLEEAPSVLLTTNDDAVNVYLAVYCRRLKPDLRIVSRITHDRNLEAIHRAGADFVLSYSSLGAEAVMSIIEGHELVLLGEGVDLFSVPLPSSLANKTLAETGISSRTGLSVVAVQQNGRMVTSLRASMQMEPGAQLFMLGSVAQRQAFIEAFG
jgi:Trk K+ transport system NAD-binding subunit